MPRVVSGDEQQTAAGRITRSLRNRLISADSDTSRSTTPVNELSPILEKEKSRTSAMASPKPRTTRKGSQADANTPAKSASRSRRGSQSEVDTKSVSSPSSSTVSDDDASTSSRTRLRKGPFSITTPIKEENENLEIESSAKRRGRPPRIIKDKGNKEAQKSTMSLKSKKTNSAIVESDAIINLDDDDDDEEEKIKSLENTSNDGKKSPSSDEKNSNKKMMIKLKKMSLEDGIQEHDGNATDIKDNKTKEDDVNKKKTKELGENKKDDIKDHGSDVKEITPDENEKEENNPKENNIETPILRDKRKKEDDSKNMNKNESLDQAVLEDKKEVIIEKGSLNESEKGDDKIDAEEVIPSYTVENKNKDNVTQNKENENILISQKESEKQDKGQEDVEKLKSILEESIVNKDDITNTNFTSNDTQDINLEKPNIVEDTVTNDIPMDEADKDDVNIDSNVTEDQDFDGSNAVDSESKDLKKDKEQQNTNSPEAQNKILQENSDSYLTEQSEKNTTKDNEDIDKSKKQKSVTFDTYKTDKKSTNYPKTPQMVKSKSYSDSRSISKRCLDSSHDTDTSTDISALSKESNEKSQENSNSEKIDENVFHDSETPYKGLRGKSSLSSSTPIATSKNQIEDDNKTTGNLAQDKTNLPNPITEDSQINEPEEPTNTLKEDIKKTSKSDTLKVASASSPFQKENETKTTEFEFSKTWSQSVTVNVTNDAKKGKYIDGFGIQTEGKKEVKTTKLSGEKTVPKRTSHSDSESYEESEIDEYNETRNEFIDDEAEEAEEENSLCSEERAYLEENEVPVDGISIGSADTDGDNEEEEDECDSFIVSDCEEDDELLSYDTDEIFSNSDDNSVKQRKQKRRAILLVQSSDEESNADTSKPDMTNSVLMKTKKRARILISSDEEENDSVILSTSASEKIDRKNLTLKDRIISLEAISEDHETSRTSDINNDTENIDECISPELVADGNTSKDLGSAKAVERKDESTQVDIDLSLIKTKTSTTQTSPESEKEGDDINLLEASTQKDENNISQNSEVLNQPSSSIQGGNSLDENAQEKESTLEEDYTSNKANRKLSFSSEQQGKSLTPNKSANLGPTLEQTANISILNVKENSLTIQGNIAETSMYKSKETELLASVGVEEEQSSVTTSEKGGKTENTSLKILSKDIQKDFTSDISISNKEDGLKPTGKKETEITNTQDGVEQNKSLELAVKNKRKKISSNDAELEQREQPSTSTLNNDEESTSVLNSAEVNENDVTVKFASFKNNSLELTRKRKLAAKQKVLSSSFSGFANNKCRASQDSTDSEEDIATKPVQKKLKKTSLSHSLNQSLIPENKEQPDTSESSADEQNEIDSNNKETIRNESTFSFMANQSDFASSSKITSRSRTECDKKPKGDSNKKYNLTCEDYQLANDATTSKNICKNDLKDAGISSKKFSPNLKSVRSAVIATDTETEGEEENKSWENMDDSKSSTSSLDEEEARLIQPIEEMEKKRTKKQIEELSIENLQIPEDKEQRKAIAKALAFRMFLLKKQVLDLTTARVAKYGNATPSELALINSRAMKLKKLKKAKGLANDECFLQQESAFSVYSDEYIRLVPDSLIEALDKEHHNATRVAVESQESSGSAAMSKKKRKKRKVAAAKTSKQSSPENISRLIKTSSGMFCEEPIKPKRKSDNMSQNYKKVKHLSTIEVPTGLVYEQPLTPIYRKLVNGFQETVATPRSIGFKISNILSAGQKETPEYRKDIRGKRKLQLQGPSKVSPKPKWKNSGEFTVTKYAKPKSE